MNVTLGDLMVAALLILVLFVLVASTAIVAPFIALSLARKNKALAQENETLKTEKSQLDAQVGALSHENQNLSQYRHIVDVQREVESIRSAVAAQVATTNQQCAAALGEANAQAAAQIGGAQQRSASIIAEANTRARDIAAEALEARDNLETYRREAQALTNIIEGYGDRYIIPSHSVLDELAESFGFTEAGASLKQARERTRALIKGGQAAACEYVEANRRETAIAFVVDAFNGKVDSILSRVKADNVGTLRQEILDAFSLVNLNGRAFREARIVDDYLKARLDELRWAAAAQELKNKEREEQRLIKEQIREEEKARREYERAMKDAAKEEDAIRRAMEKAQREIEKAGEAQKAKYEAQLVELSTKLQLAEEKNKRALSMAQQTKTGHVYIISNVGSFGDDVFKIGLTRRLEPMDRIRELGDASVPFEFDVHALILSEDAPALERALHRHFLASQINKVNPRKEFFRVSLKVVRQEIEKLGIQASWTMISAAAEYRESLAIEKAIRENPTSYEAWLNKQLILDPVVLDEAERDGSFVGSGTPEPVSATAE